jgi:MBG domain (YGX type)
MYGGVGGEERRLSPLSRFTGAAQYSTNATSASGVGSYPIQVGRGSLALNASVAANYTFSLFNQGTLTITLRAQTINFSPLNRAVYGDILSLLSVSSSGLPITYALSGPAYFQGGASTVTADSGVLLNDLFTSAAGTLTVTATQPGNNQYAAAPPVAQTIQIARATLYITSDSFTREFGAANPTLTYQVGTPTVGAPGAFVNGDTDNPSVITAIPDVSTDAVATSPAGTYSIVITAGTLAAPNYNFQFFNGTLTVLPAGSYTITSDPTSLTIPSGQSRQATITITPQNLYQGTVTLSCGQLPANATCIFSPSTYTFTGSDNPTGGANVAVGTLTVNTEGGQTVVGAIEGKPTSVFRASVLLLPSSLGGLILLLNRRRLARRKWVWQVGMAILLAAVRLG